jgi:hypothetical protein
MATTVRRSVVAATAFLVAGVGSGSAGSLRLQGTQLPLLAPAPELSIDRDLPPAVRARLEREQSRLARQARAAARIQPTTGLGCERSGIRGAPGGLGPPAPQVLRRSVLGHHVEVVFGFRTLPRSPACRPWLLDVVTYSGRKASPTFKNWVEHYRIRSLRGRVVLDLPWGGRPPYRLIVSTDTITGLPSRGVDLALRCPRAGCLPGYQPAPHSDSMPKPVLPIRGLDRPTLEATLRYVLADERTRPVLRAVPRSSRCPSLTTCVVTYVDPAFPASPYRVRYRIAGEQLPGCWMGLRQGTLDPLPFPDAATGRLELAACASWV